MILKDQARPGRVVEYLHGNAVLCAIVTDLRGDKAGLFNQNGREARLPANRLLPWPGPDYPETLSRAERDDVLRRHAARRAELAREVDMDALWELAQGEMATVTAAWCAELLFDRPDSDQVAAVGRAMLEDKARFKFAPPRFEVHDAARVEKRLAEQKRQEEKSRFLELASGAVRLLHAHQPRIDPALLRDLPEDVAVGLRRLLLTLVRDPDDPQARQTWAEVRKGLTDDGFLPLLLAQTWGVLPPHHDVLSDRAGYVLDDAWAAEYAAETERLADRALAVDLPADDRTWVSIDAPTTRDIDDAFVVEERRDGFVLSLALACPVLEWEFCSPLDQAVSRRASSLYLPEATGHMLPRVLAEERFSLRAGKPVPSLVLRVTLSSEGDVRETALALHKVTVDRNLSYSAVQEMLDTGATPPMLTAADRLAGLLRRRRIREGAVQINTPDPEIRLWEENGNIRVNLEPDEPAPDAQRMVAEFMILANACAASFALEHAIPVLFRTQDITLPGNSAGEWTDPVDVYAFIRCMAPAVLETEPRPHATVAAAAYAPITSPLRRYTDFVNVAQLAAFLQYEAPRFSRSDLDLLLPRLSADLARVASVQRCRPRYWKLTHLAQQGREHVWPGVVVDVGPGYVTMSMPAQQLLVRAPRALFADPPRPGERLGMVFSLVDPLRNEMRVGEIAPDPMMEE